jgi:hypothetical protein
MDDWGVAPALCLFSAVLRFSLLSPFGREGRASASEGKGVGLGEGRVRVSLRWDAAPANSSPPACAVLRRGRQSSPLYERREANQPAPSVFQPISVLR